MKKKATIKFKLDTMRVCVAMANSRRIKRGFVADVIKEKNVGTRIFNARYLNRIALLKLNRMPKV